MKHKKFVFVSAGLIGIIVVIGIFFHWKDQPKVEYVMSVDHLKVSKDEMKIVISDIRSRSQNKIINTYKVSTNDFDWNKDYGQKKAYQYLLDDFKEEIVYIKTIQQLGIEANIIDDFNYETFLEMLEKENKTRATQIANHEAVYGLKEFNEKQYYDYINNNLFLKVKTDLIKNEKVTITEAEIKKSYQDNKASFDNLSLNDVKDSVENMCYEKKIDEYIKNKEKEIKINCNEQELVARVKEMIK